MPRWEQKLTCEANSLSSELGEGHERHLFIPVAIPTITELNCALRESLESRGVLGQLKARIRAEVFSALDDQSEPRPALSHDNLLINELIREYLEFNKYRYTASVLTAESGQPEVPIDRQFMANELKVVEDPSSRSVPLLYGLLSHFLSSSGDSGGKLFLRGSAPANMTRDPNTLPGPES